MSTIAGGGTGLAVCALGYLGIRSDRLDDWSYFAGKLLGMQQIDRAGQAMAFRMDDRKQRLVVSNEPGDTLAFMGWEVEFSDDLERYAARLDDAGTYVEWGSAQLADRRFVDRLLVFNDPDGNRIELFHKPMITSDPFVSGRPISGFLTGPHGMGHAVLHVKDADKLLYFYRDLLDFHVSDYGLKPYPLYFFHVNGRHHSFAMVGTGRSGFHHFMVEFLNIDDVGQGYDIAQMDEDRIAFTLGRHTNDYMLSYYANTPSDFFVESGWGGRTVDPATWEPQETHVGPSFWGHERLYLPQDSTTRRRLREMRMQTAEEGKQTPMIVDCPWLYGELARPTGKKA